MIKSPLRYPGGKSRAVDRIAAMIPPFDEFREPFVGGGSLFIHTRQRFPDKRYWINDLYEELYLFWRESRDGLSGMVDFVRNLYDRFTDGKELYAYLNENFDNYTESERAAAFFVYNRITFSGTTLSGGYSNQAFDKRFTLSSIERLAQLDEVMRGVVVTNDDYAKVVNADGDNVFIFLDPPYYSAEKSALYGRKGNLHKGFDHRRFAETMRQCSHRWLITYDDCEYIRELFDFAHIYSWEQSYGMKNVAEQPSQNGQELFICNYDINNTSKQMNLF